MATRFVLAVLLAIQLLFMISMSSCKAQTPLLETVSSVDLDRYAGKWYEIASFPQRFQKGCECTTATYSISDRGHVVVENQCRKGGSEGKISYIKGKAFVEPNSGNAKLKVQFFWPFKGKYWIIDLASDYTYAVVGHPNRKYLWILSRTPQMDDDVYGQILQKLIKSGFDIQVIQKTIQNCNE
jgi:apolipoprotein D and lipocalin family protein